MKASDLENARLIAVARGSNKAMRDRLGADEKLTLMVGDGAAASAIVLSPSYVGRIRADLIAALDQRIAENEAALAALGVEL